MKSIVKIFLIISISIMILVLFYFSIDYWKHRTRVIHCDDGERETIDYNELQIKYSSNKISIDVEVINNLKMRSDIDSKILQTAYESTQNWDQFLKGLVAGYNGCAISKKDYTLILQRYKKTEEITKSLSQVLKKSPLTHQDVETANKLIDQYSLTSRELFMH